MDDALIIGPQTPRGRDAAEEEHLKGLELHFQATPFGSPVRNTPDATPTHGPDSEEQSSNASAPPGEETRAKENGECQQAERCDRETSSPYTALFRLPSLPETPATPSTISNPGIVPQLQNIVATADLGCRLELKKIALQARNAEYNPRRFAAAILRIREPRTTALFFNSGKIVCTGAKSESQSRIAARKFARIAQKLGFDASFSDFKIQNIVASCDVGFSIRLEGLALNHARFCRYEPELFPGLVYSMMQPRVILLIFVSGKIVLTGAKVRQELYEAFDSIYPILINYRKHT